MHENLTKIFSRRRESFWEGHIVIFRDVAFDMLPGPPDRDVPIGSWTQGPRAQKAFRLELQIWQSVLKRWKLNSWEEASQLERTDHLRRETGPKKKKRQLRDYLLLKKCTSGAEYK